jgi:hypothetical protein
VKDRTADHVGCLCLCGLGDLCVRFLLPVSGLDVFATLNRRHCDGEMTMVGHPGVHRTDFGTGGDDCADADFSLCFFNIGPHFESKYLIDTA